MTTRPNEYVFPELNSDYCEGVGYKYYTAGNITKRELFAAMAMQGLLSTWWTKDRDVTHEQIIAIATESADYLISELNREEGK